MSFPRDRTKVKCFILPYLNLSARLTFDRLRLLGRAAAAAAVVALGESKFFITSSRVGVGLKEEIVIDASKGICFFFFRLSHRENWRWRMSEW